MLKCRPCFISIERVSPVTVSSQEYIPKSFTPTEGIKLSRLTEVILPVDETLSTGVGNLVAVPFFRQVRVLTSEEDSL
jgi:hypothetical protein